MNTSRIVAFMFSIRKGLSFRGREPPVVTCFVAISTGDEVTLTIRSRDFLSLLRSQFLVVAIAPTATAIRKVTFQFRGSDLFGFAGCQRGMIARGSTFPAI
jgi:hypothetical protein